MPRRRIAWLVAPPTTLRGLRAHWLLRQLAKSTCQASRRLVLRLPDRRIRERTEADRAGQPSRRPAGTRPERPRTAGLGVAAELKVRSAPLAAFTFGDGLLTVVQVVAMFAWILIAAAVVFDIFRNRDLSKWSKVAWVLVVIVLPLVGVAVPLDRRVTRSYRSVTAWSSVPCLRPANRGGESQAGASPFSHSSMSGACRRAPPITKM
jgi:Phospholipase_D-nuclease N-terminal